VFDHQVENQLGIPPVVLLPRAGAASDLGGMPDPDLVPEFGQQFFKPLAGAGSLQLDNHRFRQLGIELADFIILVVQLSPLNLAGRQIRVSDFLLSWMKINAAIGHHEASFLWSFFLSISLPDGAAEGGWL